MQDLPFDRLGPFPLLQFVAAILVVGGLALAIYRGTRDRKNGTTQTFTEQRWFFDGPLLEALKLLRDNRTLLHTLADAVAKSNEEQRDQTEVLRNIKNILEEHPLSRRR